MYRLIYDQNNYLKDESIKRINSYSSFLNVYKSIIEINQKSLTETYIVGNVTIHHWLKNLAGRYPPGTFLFENIDARGALAQQWGMDIPANVTNEDIVQTGLLTSGLHLQPGFSFEDALLAHFYNPIFISKTFPFTQLTSLVESVDPQQWKANHATPLLVRTLHTRLDEWKSKARSSEQRQLVELFAADPSGIKVLLMRFRVLQRYQELGEALLGDTFDLLRTLKLQLDDLKIEETKIPETILQVTYLLNNLQPKDVEDLTALLYRMSGLLLVEFETIEKNLRDHTDWVTPELVEQIEDKFSSQSRRLAHKIAALRGLICPPKPGYPDFDWDADTMLSWVTQRYLPYQAWCSAKEQFDGELYSIGDRFSEWLISHWSDLHANSNRFVFNILANKAAGLKQTGRVNLVLVIDNLAWSYSETVRSLFEERGYFLTNAEPYLAMLPSETEISKKCLLAGAVGYNAIDDKTYKGMIEKGWVPYFNDSAFRYVSDIGSLGKIETIDASTYVVNYLAIDKALHKSADEIGMPHTEHVTHLLLHLVENVIAFIDKHALQDKIRIHIVSDHGSTRIPATIQNDLDPNFFKASGFEARSHRYVEVSDEKFASLADNLKLDCFFLPAHEFINPKNVLCARHANRFLPTDQYIYVHGGLLPEEVIVPYMAFEPVTVPIQDVTILLKKNEFRYRMETVELEVGNPNDAALEQVQVILLNGNAESELVTISLLNSKSKVAVTVKARFKLTSLPEEQNKLRLRVRFRARGEVHTTDAQANIVMRKLVEEKSSGLFED